MAYSKQVYRALPGSLNLRANPTEIADSESQRCVNLAFDEASSLRSRRGHTAICSASNVKQMLNALDSRWQAISSAYICGFKDFVWKVGGGSADKDCGAIISTGGPRKSDGTNDWRWIPQAPATKPTIASAADALTTVDDFSDGWAVDPSGDEANGTSFGLFIQGQADTVYSAEKAVNLNLYDGFDKDDIFKIRLKCKKWSKISGVAFDVDVDDGSFTKNYYKTKILLKEIKAARKEEITFYIRKRILETDVAAEDKFKYANFERVGQSPDKDWRSVVRLRAKVEFNDATKFWFSDWSLQGNEDNKLEGDDFGVYYTFTTAAGHESNPSPKSDLITVNRGSIHVTGMEESADPQVTGKNIYLTGGTLGAVYRVNTEPVTGTEYTITQSADDLTNFNIQLEDDHNDPPNADGIAPDPYYGRILAFKGRRFYWSKQNKPYAFVNPDGDDGDWAPVSENAGDIKYISIRPHEAWIYAENEIFVLIGDPADANGEVHPSKVAQGTPSRTGVAPAGSLGDLVYYGSGLGFFAGSALSKISHAIEPIFEGRSVKLWDGTTATPISDKSSVAVGYEDGVCWLSHSGGTLKLHIASNRWYQDDRLFSCFQAEGEAGILGALSSGGVVQLEQGTTDGGSAISINYLSKAYDFGINDSEKRVEDVTIFHDTNGQDLTATVYYAQGVSAGSGVLNSFGDGRTVIQLNNGDGIRARNFAVGITGSVSAEAIIRAIDFNYYPEAREAKSYDTAVVDAGTSKVKLIRELQLSLENDNTVAWKLETDIPGFALGSRETGTIGTNLFRRTQGLVMTAERYAHDFRVVCDGTGYFRLFTARAKAQIVGTYLQGQVGEYYLSDPVDFGTERVKLVREAELIYSCVGSTPITVSTDIPGNTIVTRGTAVLPPSTGEQSVKVRFPANIRGRLIQGRLDPPVDFRLEAFRLYIKIMGEAGATAWNWVSFPISQTQDAIWIDLPLAVDQVG